MEFSELAHEVLDCIGVVLCFEDEVEPGLNLWQVWNWWFGHIGRMIGYKL